MSPLLAGLLAPAAAAVTVILARPVASHLAWRAVPSSRIDRHAIASLDEAIDRYPQGAALFDKASENILVVRPDSHGTRSVDRQPLREVRDLESEFLLGEETGTMSWQRFLIRGRRVAAMPRTALLRAGADRDDLPTEIPPPAMPLREILRAMRTHATLGTSQTTSAEVLELAQQIVRAKVVDREGRQDGNPDA